MRWFARLVTRHPAAIVMAVALASLAALHGLVDLRTGRLRIEVDPAIERLLPEGDDERRFYDRARELFGSDRLVLLVLETDDAFAPAALERLRAISQAAESVAGVQSVVSLSTALDVEDRDGEIYLGPFFEEVPSAPDALAALRQRVASHPLYGSTLVSTDGRAAAALVSFDRMSDGEFAKAGLSERVAEAAAAVPGEGRVLVTGMPHVKLHLSRIILAEMGFIIPSVLVVSALLCIYAFRSARGVVLPLLAIGIAELWTLGSMSWSGAPFNLVSNIIPPLVITLGFATAMHVMSEYYTLLQDHPATDSEENRTAVAHVLEEMGLTVFVNGVTTVLGFASLGVSSVSAVREFGIWSCFGVASVTLLSLTFIPALLVWLGPPKRLPSRPGGDRIERLADAIASFAVRRRLWIFAAAVAVLALCAVGMLRIRVSTSVVGIFREASPIRTDFELASERFGGLNPFLVVVEAEEDGAFTRPENLRVLRELQDWLEAQPEVGHTASLADPVRLLNRAFSGNAPGALAIPERSSQVKQLLRFGGDDVTQGFIDAGYRTANVVVRTGVTESEPMRELLDRVQTRLAELPQRLRARSTGDAVLLPHTADQIARGQLESIGVALATIYLTMSLLLMSFRVGFYALIPNLIPITVYFGVLGLLDVPLNLSTSLIAAIALGIAVDDTVHYFSRFALEARRLGDEAKATASTLRSLIRPVTFTALALSLGFLVLTFSELRYQVQFGLLSAFTMIVAWLLELSLSPAICSRLRLVTLWDVVRLDLGHDPQKSIPLFDGLSQRQARIFALMSSIVEVPAGKRLFAEGDKGAEMFVVIDGELSAATERDGRRVEYSRMRRGDAVGEVALFSEGRTADVDVTEDARLLRFGNADLDRLGRRYPRVAAKVYRNLNRILALRVVRTAEALR